MKNLNGSRQIISPLSQKSPTRVYDSWPSHGTLGFVCQAMTQSSTGTLALVTEWQLKGGTNYFYVSEFTASGETATVRNSYLSFQAPNIGGFYAGESYNAIVRPRETTKWTYDQLAAWLAG